MVRLEEHKHDTEDKPIERMTLPVRVYIPLIQHLGKMSNPLVKVGDTISLGQKIADVSAHVCALIHASVDGKVIAIQDWPHPVLGRCKAIVIESNGEAESQAQKAGRLEGKIEALTPEEIRNIVFEAGIVGMGGASFPTHIKLNPSKPLDTLIVNIAECEPYLSCDARLAIEKTEEILKGVKLVARCVGVKKVIIAIEDNKPEAIKKFMVHGSWFMIKTLKSAYPQGGEKQLIKNVLDREVPSGKLPFDIGVLVHNVGTIFAIYEAVYKNKPLYERVVTVAGSCVANPKNLLVRVGTPIKDLINFCGLKGEPAKIIMGGPMMGIAQFSDQVPIIKSSSGLLLLNKKESAALEENFCIRCGACVRECPVGLMPCMINLSSEKGLWQQAKLYGAPDCIECGICNYVCPANRRLIQSIKRAKLEMAK